MKYYFGLLLFLLSAPVSADQYNFYTVVGYQCNQARDMLELTYDGDYDIAGENLVRNKKQDQWDLWSLHFDKKPVRKQCNLSDGKYELTISTYSTGTCYSCFGIWAKVTNGDKVIFNEGLDGFEGPPTQTVISRALIKSHGAQPELTTLTWDEFLNHARPD
jgi:hypothetical protein